jgi:hypothetical protein
MKPKQDSLERLFKSAAQAPHPLPGQAPFAVEACVLAALRCGSPDGDEMFGFLPLFRRGLAFACVAAIVAVAISYAGQSASMDETAILNSVAEISYLP